MILQYRSVTAELVSIEELHFQRSMMFLQAGFLLCFFRLCHNYPQYDYYNHDKDNDYYSDNQSQDNNGNGYDYGGMYI